MSENSNSLCTFLNYQDLLVLNMGFKMVTDMHK